MGEITGVLLAAGFSTRFGANKLLTVLGDRPIIAHSAAALSPCDRLVAVVRVVDAALQSELHRLGIDCVFNTEPERGMGHSIACAVKATAHSGAWCILPADMPSVKAATTCLVADALRAGAALAAPAYRGQRGHPVGFGARFFDRLSGLDGDIGARRIIAQNSARMTLIDTDDAGVLADIDCTKDLNDITATTRDNRL